MYKGTPNCLMYCSGAKSPTVASSLLPVASLVPVKQKTTRRRFNVQSLRGVMDQTVYDGWHVNTTKFTTPSMCVCKNYKNPTYREVNSLKDNWIYIKTMTFYSVKDNRVNTMTWPFNSKPTFICDDLIL